MPLKPVSVLMTLSALWLCNPRAADVRHSGGVPANITCGDLTPSSNGPESHPVHRTRGPACRTPCLCRDAGILSFSVREDPYLGWAFCRGGAGKMLHTGARVGNHIITMAMIFTSGSPREEMGSFQKGELENRLFPCQKHLCASPGGKLSGPRPVSRNPTDGFHKHQTRLVMIHEPGSVPSLGSARSCVLGTPIQAQTLVLVL